MNLLKLFLFRRLMILASERSCREIDINIRVGQLWSKH